jgi:hypothetical protein
VLRQCFYIETVRFLCHEGVSERGADKGDVERIKFAEKVMNSIPHRAGGLTT